MKPALIDTDILSLFFKNNQTVVSKFKSYLKYYPTINISIITYYEIVSGLEYKNAIKQLKKFYNFIPYINVLPITSDSADTSAEIYKSLRQKGEILDDLDILIAGIALSNNLVIVTNNEKHFKRIKGLAIENWSK